MIRRKFSHYNMHRIAFTAVLCFLGFSIVAFAAPRKQRKGAKKEDPRVYLEHADELQYDMYGDHPDAQIARTISKGSTGKVKFRHKGGYLVCDSAYFYEQENSVDAFGHVHYWSGDTLSLVADYARYDGNEEMAWARRNVVLTHKKSKLYTDSLNYDRMYGVAYFFDGGKLIDGGSTLTSDWGQYNTETKQSVFYYKVRLKNKKSTMLTDTLYYDNGTSTAHVVGRYTNEKGDTVPSVMIDGGSTVYTTDGYYDTKQEKSQLYGRSTVINADKTITADSMFTYGKSNCREGFGNVVYDDVKNKNRFLGNHVYYDEDNGYGWATDSAVVIDYSEKDTLYMHGDSIKLYTYNINTDSVYREVHAFNKVRAFRRDIQAVCDSMVYNSKDSCITMYRDPIVWNMGRQVLGEIMHAYLQDSTVRYADVIGQTLTVDRLDSLHFNQVAAKEIQVFFEQGNPRQTWYVGNVTSIYYPMEDSDSSLIGLNFLETDTMKMYITEKRELDHIWTSKATGTLYPITQIPPQKKKLDNFAWFEHIRPIDKDDIFIWRGKGEGMTLKEEKRRRPHP